MRPVTKRNAYVNTALIAVNILVFLIMEARGSTEDAEYMLEHGAMFIPYIIRDGQYYRLLTSTFMHFGITHLVNNMLILFVLGDNMERALGRIKYLIFYLLCGIGANVVSMIAHMNNARMLVSAGASGAIFGVVGGLLYAVIINRGRLEDLSTRQLVVMCGFSLYFGLTSSGTDNMAHIGGFVIGFLLSAILYRKPVRRTQWYEA